MHTHHRLWLATALCLGLSCTRDTGQIQPPADRSVNVQAGLRAGWQVADRPVVIWSLAGRMAHYKIPGVSIAVVDSGRIVWARGFGLKQTGTADSVTATTLFQAASISKPVTATATLHLVDQGKLALDENVNTYLTSWKVPDNQFTAREKVTLRRILSHSAGLSVHGFPGYAVTDALPTVVEVLNGAKPRANTDPVRVVAVPGTAWSYSGGGTTIMQLILADVTGKTFPALMREIVLGPAGMTASTYEQPLPTARAAEAASGHLADGSMLPGHWHVYPEMAPAGLWTTPTDLLKWAIEIAATRAGRSTRFFSQDMARQMLTVVKAPTGLGPFLAGEGRSFQFGHGGDNVGFHADVVYFPETGQGAAIMTNGDNGQDLITEIKTAIGTEYAWPDAGPKTITAVAIDSARLALAVGEYVIELGGQAIPATVAWFGGKLLVSSAFQPAQEELVPQSATTFIGIDHGYRYEFAGPAGRKAGTVRIDLMDGMVLTGRRKPPVGTKH